MADYKTWNIKPKKPDNAEHYRDAFNTHVSQRPPVIREDAPQADEHRPAVPSSSKALWDA